MCCCQRARNLAGYLEHVQQLHARIHPLAQSLTIDKLGGDEPRIACGANLVNCEDVRMIQSRGCLRFLNESLQTLLIGRQPLGKNFDGNRSIKFRVTRQINFTHSTLTNFRADFIATEFCAGARSHSI